MRENPLGAGAARFCIRVGSRADITRHNGGRDLWLTTYGHLTWNQPFYERARFVVIRE